jgi:hypothetical protein
MFLVFVPVVHEVLIAMSLLIKYTVAYLLPAMAVLGAVTESVAEPVLER